MTLQVRATAEFLCWLDSLEDRVSRARIQVRIDRLIHGNAGKHRHLTSGVSELKIDTGPGYRVYYTQRGMQLLILLVDGDKSSQQKDIARAIRLVRTLQE
jgi:putative addiction module killer protein